MFVKLPEVKKVGVAWTKMMPPGLLVFATAHVTQVGWSNVQLVPRMYITPPADGVWDMDLMGQFPEKTITLYLPREIDAEPLHVPNVPKWVKGVRVHASTNKKSSLEEKYEEFDKAALNWVPYPWSGSGEELQGDPGDSFPWMIITE